MRAVERGGEGALAFRLFSLSRFQPHDNPTVLSLECQLRERRQRETEREREREREEETRDERAEERKRKKEREGASDCHRPRPRLTSTRVAGLPMGSEMPLRAMLLTMSCARAAMVSYRKRRARGGRGKRGQLLLLQAVGSGPALSAGEISGA